MVQYALDTLGDDHLTVGMIAIDEDGSKAATAFVPNWRRARCFGAGGTEFLESFAKSLAQKAGGPNDFIPPQITVDELEEMSRDYRNAIRLTAPTRIDLSATEWVRDYAHLFVPDLEAHAEVERSRKTVDKIVRDTKSVMTRFLQARYRIPNASQCVQPFEVIGEFGQLRRLAATIRNADGDADVHFGTIPTTLDHEEREAQARVDQTVETVRDVRKRIPGTPLIVVIDSFETLRIPEHRRGLMETQLQKKCEKESVRVVRHDEVGIIEAEVERAMTPRALESLFAYA